MDNPCVFRLEETPKPQEWLRRYLDYLNWANCNAHRDSSFCQQEERIELRQNRMCCLQATLRLVEEYEMMLAGKRAGLLYIPDGYERLGKLASKRLAELMEGKDDFETWMFILQALEKVLYDWVGGKEYNSRGNHPYFDVPEFVRMWKEIGLKMDNELIADSFGLQPEYTLSFW